MIFVGDIALPYKAALDYSEIPMHFFDKNRYGNLDGAIVSTDVNNLSAVYNHKDAIIEVLENFNYSVFALGINHIFDVVKSETTDFISENNIPFCGIGNTIEEANSEVVFFENDVQIVIVNIIWEVIHCEIVSENIQGINPLIKHMYWSKFKN